MPKALHLGLSGCKFRLVISYGWLGDGAILGLWVEDLLDGPGWIIGIRVP